MTATRREGYAEVNGGRLWYEIAGEGETIVFSHAAFLDSGMWDGQFEAFAARYRTVRYDLRGFGRSDPATGPVSRRGDLAALLDALGITRASLVGCSMSGEAVLDLAFERPDLVAQLVVVAGMPSGWPWSGEMEPNVEEMIAAAQAGDVERASELQVRIWFDGRYREPHEVDQELRRKALAMNRIAVARDTFMIADSEPPNPLEPPAYGRLGELAIPAMIVIGALDQPETNEAGRVMAERIPGARFREIANAAHVPNMERPEEFNREVLAFLAGA